MVPVVLPKTAGAYVLTHVKTGCFYVGSSSNIRLRVGYHFNRLKLKLHHLAKLQGMYNVDPEISVTYELTEDREAAFDIEQRWLDERGSDEKMLNIGRDARRSNYGLTRSEESKAKARASQSTPERIEFNRSIGLANKGRMHTEESMRNLLDKCARPVIIDGVEYVSAADASRTLNIKRQTLEKRCRSNTYSNYVYKTAIDR